MLSSFYNPILPIKIVLVLGRFTNQARIPFQRSCLDSYSMNPFHKALVTGEFLLAGIFCSEIRLTPYQNLTFINSVNLPTGLLEKCR